MFNHFKISTRIQAGFAIVLILVLAVVIAVVNVNISDVVHEAEKKELENLYKSAVAEIESEGRLAQAMSLVIASNKEMSQAMAEGRRDDLAASTVPLFKKLKKEFSVRQFQFHLPPATSFLRAHKAKKFGDDLSSFRKTFVYKNVLYFLISSSVTLYCFAKLYKVSFLPVLCFLKSSNSLTIVTLGLSSNFDLGIIKTEFSFKPFFASGFNA